MSDEVRNKISKSRKWHITSKETREKISKANTWKIRSKEARAKIGIAVKWRILSKETRLKMSNSRKWEKHHLWKGGVSKNSGKYQRDRYHNLTEEERQKVSWQKNKRNRVIKRLKTESLSHTYGEWELLKKQYNYTCPCCHKSELEIKLTEDHIIPLEKGGSDLIENIQPLCLKCNMKKHTKIIKY